MNLSGWIPLDPGQMRVLSACLGLAFLLVVFPLLIARGAGIHRLCRQFPALDQDSIMRTCRWVSTEVDFAGSNRSAQMPLNYSLGQRALHISAPFPFSLGARGRASIPWTEVTLAEGVPGRGRRRWESIPLIGTSFIHVQFTASGFPATFSISGRCAGMLLEQLDSHRRPS